MFDTIVVFPLQSLLTFFYNVTVTLGIPNYGTAIILLTIAIKLVLYPLTVKQISSMKAMQELQPKIKELQEKYKSNPEKMNKELAAIYKQSGVNPLAGCLPMIIQMPFLIGIFYAIRDFHYVDYPGFLWMSNLAQNSSVVDPYYIVPILSAATTYLQQKQTMASSDPKMNQQNQIMLIFMPLFIGYITLTFPAGLGVYWVVSNLIQIVQQWWMYRKPAVIQGEAQ
ncbi:putative membrane protein [Propionispora sp. 2/2-37]|uniref:YidC/Oxa1 family membrane protein insertase n=1 Tax=Propionispora sp. 2/2-37 TaxID=1677858 RepID=UPI0006C1B489|nr:YidC/Oxa1 family membrane protein insertase [Propionispora sp. 2/2-37]CUH95770.1 putative membrane protein [Propionispora sp. 2/2-37]